MIKLKTVDAWERMNSEGGGGGRNAGQEMRENEVDEGLKQSCPRKYKNGVGTGGEYSSIRITSR